MYRLTDEDREEVCKSFNTSREQVKKDVEVLKEWMKQQPHLPQYDNDVLLTAFLIGCKNRMERAKEKIEKYFSNRLKMPGFFQNRDLEQGPYPLGEEEILFYVLPKITPDRCIVAIATMATGDPSHFDLGVFARKAFSYIDICLHTEPFLEGQYLIIDCQDCFTAAHVLRFTPTVVRDIINCAQDVMPLVFKAVVIINAPFYAQLALNVCKPFLKAKLLQRVYIHCEGPEILEKYFPRKLLPKNYGGEAETTDVLQERMNQFLREKREWLMGEGSITVDEKKRVGGTSHGKDSNYTDLQGSFKTLCVD